MPKGRTQWCIPLSFLEHNEKGLDPNIITGNKKRYLCIWGWCLPPCSLTLSVTGLDIHACLHLWVFLRTQEPFGWPSLMLCFLYFSSLHLNTCQTCNLSFPTVKQLESMAADLSSWVEFFVVFTPWISWAVWWSLWAFLGMLSMSTINTKDHRKLNIPKYNYQSILSKMFVICLPTYQDLIFY